MKHLTLKAAIFAAIYSSSLTAAAANTDDVYASLQYAQVTYDHNDIGEITPTALIGKLGLYLTDNFSIEGRAGFGLQDDKTENLGTDVTLEIDNIFGIYGVGHFDLGPTASVYGLLGYAQAKAKFSTDSFGTATKDESSLSLGIGADIDVADNFALNIEYVQYLKESDFDLNALSFGVTLEF